MIQDKARRHALHAMLTLPGEYPHTFVDMYNGPDRMYLGSQIQNQNKGPRITARTSNYETSVSYGQPDSNKPNVKYLITNGGEYLMELKSDTDPTQKEIIPIATTSPDCLGGFMSTLPFPHLNYYNPTPENPNIRLISMDQPQLQIDVAPNNLRSTTNRSGNTTSVEQRLDPADQLVQIATDTFQEKNLTTIFQTTSVTPYKDLHWALLSTAMVNGKPLTREIFDPLNGRYSATVPIDKKNIHIVIRDNKIEIEGVNPNELPLSVGIYEEDHLLVNIPPYYTYDLRIHRTGMERTNATRGSIGPDRCTLTYEQISFTLDPITPNPRPTRITGAEIATLKDENSQTRYPPGPIEISPIVNFWKQYGTESRRLEFSLQGFTPNTKSRQ